MKSRPLGKHCRQGWVTRTVGGRCIAELVAIWVGPNVAKQSQSLQSRIEQMANRSTDRGPFAAAGTHAGDIVGQSGQRDVQNIRAGSKNFEQ